jgi:hypothetical protein
MPQPPLFSLDGFLKDVLVGQESVRKLATFVEWEDDPSQPGRRAYRISGASKAAVQGVIDRLTRGVEDAGGWANFIGPHPIEDGSKFGALGEVMETAEAAA